MIQTSYGVRCGTARQGRVGKLGGVGSGRVLTFKILFRITVPDFSDWYRQIQLPTGVAVTEIIEGFVHITT